jgi:hypothetical protein
MIWGLDLIWVTLCATAVLFIALWFVIHPDMKTGIMGTTGLAVLALGALSRISASWNDLDGHVNNTLPLFVWTGVALFLGHLARNFHKRLQTREDKRTDWYEVNKHHSKSS